MFITSQRMKVKFRHRKSRRKSLSARIKETDSSLIMESKLPFERMERKILVRRNADTSPFLGKLPKDRTVEEMINFGVVNIDKPQGPTSHQVCEYVKNILGLDKAGHSGTLDPNVTGV